MIHTVELSVAIATRDRPHAVLRCLRALLAGTVLPAEVIVVDQSRGDETALALARYASNSPTMIRYVRQAGSGLSRSRNAALTEARHGWVAVTDDDCVPDVRWSEAIARELSRNARLAAVTGRVLPLGPEVEGTVAVSSRLSAVRRDFTGRTVPWIVGTGANFAARREWLTRVGAYDVRLGTGSPGAAGEDMDILYRLLRAGARIRYEPDAIIYHERQTPDHRARTRTGYGRGVGACCALWLREGDPFAPWALARWLSLRLGRVGTAIRRGDGRLAREELAVLRGTAAGIAYGARVRGPRVDQDDDLGAPTLPV